MLKFEFVQPSETQKPYYEIIVNKTVTGVIAYNNKTKQWGLDFTNFWHNVIVIDHISDKIDELNESTQQQRILGVF